MIAAVGDFRELVLASCTNMRAGPVCQFLQSIWQRMPPGVEQEVQYLSAVARARFRRAGHEVLVLVEKIGRRLERISEPGARQQIAQLP